MILRIIFLLAISFCLFSCDDEGQSNYEDYREAWIGTYDCTKSSRSFEDEMFTTDIEVIVEIDTSASNLLLINNIRVPVDANGQFGLEEFGGSYFNLTLIDDRIEFSINEIFPLGDAIACYIKGQKK